MSRGSGVEVRGTGVKVGEGRVPSIVISSHAYWYQRPIQQRAPDPRITVKTSPFSMSHQKWLS